MILTDLHCSAIHRSPSIHDSTMTKRQTFKIERYRFRVENVTTALPTGYMYVAVQTKTLGNLQKTEKVLADD